LLADWTVAKKKSATSKRMTVLTLHEEQRRRMDAQKTTAHEMIEAAREIRERAIRMRKRSEEARRKTA
jgi:hypothetical protein